MMLSHARTAMPDTQACISHASQCISSHTSEKLVKSPSDDEVFYIVKDRGTWPKADRLRVQLHMGLAADGNPLCSRELLSMRA